jgi:hypothetical protein
VTSVVNDAEETTIDGSGKALSLSGGYRMGSIAFGTCKLQCHQGGAASGAGGEGLSNPCGVEGTGGGRLLHKFRQSAALYTITPLRAVQPCRSTMPFNTE